MYTEKKNTWPYIDSPWDLLVPCEIVNTTKENEKSSALCISSHILGLFSGYLFPFVGVFGIIFNFMIFYVFMIRYPPKLRTRQLIYLSALAIADNFSIITFGWLWIFPAKGLPYITNGMTYFFTFNENNPTCKAHRYIYSFASTLAVNLFLLTSIDRCLSIYQPLKYSKKGKKFAWTLVAITTVISGIIMIPFAIIISLNINKQNLIICWIDDERFAISGQLYHVLFSNCGFVQTIAIITVNLGLLFKLKNGQELRKELRNQTGSASKEISACILLVVLSSIFVVGSLPQSISYMFAMYYQSNPNSSDLVRLSYNFSDIGWHLFFIQEATNWFVYMVRMKSFRNETVNMMFCKSINTQSNLSNQTRGNKMIDYEGTLHSRSIYENQTSE